MHPHIAYDHIFRFLDKRPAVQILLWMGCVLVHQSESLDSRPHDPLVAPTSWRMHKAMFDDSLHRGLVRLALSSAHLRVARGSLSVADTLVDELLTCTRASEYSFALIDAIASTGQLTQPEAQQLLCWSMSPGCQAAQARVGCLLYQFDPDLLNIMLSASWGEFIASQSRPRQLDVLALLQATRKLHATNCAQTVRHIASMCRSARSASPAAGNGLPIGYTTWQLLSGIRTDSICTSFCLGDRGCALDVLDVLSDEPDIAVVMSIADSIAHEGREHLDRDSLHVMEQWCRARTGHMSSTQAVNAERIAAIVLAGVLGEAARADVLCTLDPHAPSALRQYCLLGSAIGLCSEPDIRGIEDLISAMGGINALPNSGPCFENLLRALLANCSPDTIARLPLLLPRLSLAEAGLMVRLLPVDCWSHEHVPLLWSSVTRLNDTAALVSVNSDVLHSYAVALKRALGLSPLQSPEIAIVNDDAFLIACQSQWIEDASDTLIHDAASIAMLAASGREVFRACQENSMAALGRSLSQKGTRDTSALLRSAVTDKSIDVSFRCGLVASLLEVPQRFQFVDVEDFINSWTVSSMSAPQLKICADTVLLLYLAFPNDCEALRARAKELVRFIPVGDCRIAELYNLCSEDRH